MSRLRCLIVDDEPLARQLLAEYVGKVSFLELHAACASPLAALDVLRTTPIDLLLLDVHMPELTGLELLSTLAHPPLVILTTAHSQYALQGFEVNAVDYLLKPITFDRFLRAAHKAGDRRLSPATAPLLPPAPAEPEFLFIKDGARHHKVNRDDILFIEGLRDYVAVHTRSQRIVSLLRLKVLAEQLPADRFARIHHSYIVGLAGMEVIERDQVRVAGRWLPVSASYRQTFRAFVDQYQCKP
jgi:two-component system LytT family response regulator